MLRALISVSDKTGIVEFAKKLETFGYEIISTGGTHEVLTKNGVKAQSVESITGFAECMDGRVKTLHPAVHGGILAVRDNDEHMAHMESLGYGMIDMVVVNLYPFKNTILKPDVSLSEAIENIDIGGPAMVRSAAKNHKFVSIVTDPADYEKILAEAEKGEISYETRVYLCAKAFAHTAAYDALIAEYMGEISGREQFPETITLTYEKSGDMRYGENPHQAAAYYKEIRPLRGSISPAKQLHGKEISFNNINDLNGAVALLKEFEEPAAVCVKHSVPCGVGEGEDIYSAYMKAYECDPVSVFGGIIALNREVDEKTAEKMNEIFLEIIIAPSFSEKALEILTKKKNIRILECAEVGFKADKDYFDIKKVLGGILIQNADVDLLEEDKITCVTKKQPTESEMQDLIFAWKVVKHTKSNAIVVAKNGQTVGIGGGQVRRSWALIQAADHGAEMLGADSTKGAVLASDAYFPFTDSIEEAHKAGITAIIQPGGSKGDSDVIELADKYGIAMIFTGMRHFRH